MRWRTTLAESPLRAFEIGEPARYAVTGRAGEAKQAIRLFPLDGRGYWWLARIAEANRETAEAERLYRLSEERGPRNVRVLAWLVDREMQSGNFERAFAHVDQLLRVQPELATRLRPAMYRLAADPAAQPEFAALLAKQPPWRSDLMPMLISQSPDSTPLFPLIERLRSEPPGLSQKELSDWIDRLGHDGKWGAAYMTWTQSLHPEQSARIGNVFNGGFESEPSQSGFDWRFAQVPGARVSRAEGVADGGGRFALQIEFEDRRVPFQHVRQLLALAPGRYRLAGRARLDDIRSERGLVWTLTCAEDGRQVGETPALTGNSAWRTFETEFEVPAAQCGGQWMTLRLPARIPAEQLIGGTIWFDDLKIKSLAR